MQLVSAGVVKRIHFGVDCVSKYRIPFNRYTLYSSTMLPDLQWFRQSFSFKVKLGYPSVFIMTEHGVDAAIAGTDIL